MTAEVFLIWFFVEIFCVTGISYCIFRFVLTKIPFKIVSITKHDDDTYIIKVSRLWLKYEYVTGREMEVNDFDRNINFKIVIQGEKENEQ